MRNNYTRAEAAKLSRLKTADFTEPSKIKVYWLNALSPEHKPELISTGMHMHTFFEAHFILRGSIRFGDLTNNIINVSEKNVIIFPPQEKHIVLDFTRDMLRISLAFLPEKNSSLFKALYNGGVKIFETTPNLDHSIADIFSELRKNDCFSQTLIQNRISDMICECSRSVGISKLDGEKIITEGDDLAIVKAKQYISDNIEKRLTCNEIAEYCHFNVKYLSRIFKAQTGMTLLEHIHKIKLNHAEALLEDETLSLRQISERLGFASEYYFNSFFHRLTGISPGQFRKFRSKK